VVVEDRPDRSAHPAGSLPPWAVVILVAAVMLHVAMMGSLFWGYLDQLFYASDRVWQALDFFSTYEAGHKALQGVSVYKFDPFFQSDSERAPYYSAYRYVPVFAYGFGAPMNALSPWNAYWGWVACNELLLVLNAYGTWRLGGKTAWAAVGAAMWFVFTPYYVEMYQGQFSFLMATLLFWAAAGLMQRRELFAGASWGVSLIAKSNSIVLAPVFLRVMWWRAIALSIGLVALNVPYFISRTSDLEYFWRASANDMYREQTLRPLLYTAADQGLLAMIENVILTVNETAANVPHALSLSLAPAIVLVSLAVTFLARNPDRLLLFSMWVSTFFLFHGWVPEYHYVMLLPVFVMLVVHRPALRAPALIAYVALALPTPYWLVNHVWNTAPILAPKIVDSLQASWPEWGVVLHHAAKPVPTLLLWAWLMVVQCRAGLGFEWLTEQRDAALRAFRAAEDLPA